MQSHERGKSEKKRMKEEWDAYKEGTQSRSVNRKKRKRWEEKGNPVVGKLSNICKKRQRNRSESWGRWLTRKIPSFLHHITPSPCKHLHLPRLTLSRQASSSTARPNSPWASGQQQLSLSLSATTHRPSHCSAPTPSPCTSTANSAKRNTSLLAEDHKFSLGHKSLSRCTSLGFLSQKGECLWIPFQPKGMLKKGKASYSFPTETDPVIPNHSPALLELSSYSVKQLPKASFIYSWKRKKNQTT